MSWRELRRGFVAAIVLTAVVLAFVVGLMLQSAPAIHLSPPEGIGPCIESVCPVPSVR